MAKPDRSGGRAAEGTRPEVALLLCCTQTRETPELPRRIVSVLQDDLDWEYLIHIALHHRVMPLVYQKLQALQPGSVPDPILETLRSHFYAHVGRNLFLAGRLLQIMALFERRGVSAVPYKGLVLAVSAYGSLSQRQCGDVDMLVHKRHYQTAQHLLIQHGFRRTKDFRWQSAFVDESGRVEVDLHKTLAHWEVRCPLDFAIVSTRLQRTVVLGTEIANLAPDDALLMLAIQIAKDADGGSGGCQLVKVCDIAALLRAHPDLDLTRTLRQAKRLGGERMLLFSLGLTNTLLGTTLPPDVSRRILSEPWCGRLIAHARQRLFGESTHAVADRLTTDQFRWLVRERLRDRLYPYIRRSVWNGRRRYLRNVRRMRRAGQYGARVFESVTRTRSRAPGAT